jgi:hypothetical protein
MGEYLKKCCLASTFCLIPKRTCIQAYLEYYVASKLRSSSKVSVQCINYWRETANRGIIE